MTTGGLHTHPLPRTPPDPSLWTSASGRPVTPPSDAAVAAARTRTTPSHTLIAHVTAGLACTPHAGWEVWTLVSCSCCGGAGGAGGGWVVVVVAWGM